jgi:hypothetical protein
MVVEPRAGGFGTCLCSGEVTNHFKHEVPALIRHVAGVQETMPAKPITFTAIVSLSGSHASAAFSEPVPALTMKSSTSRSSSMSSRNPGMASLGWDTSTVLITQGPLSSTRSSASSSVRRANDADVIAIE